MSFFQHFQKINFFLNCGVEPKKYLKESLDEFDNKKLSTSICHAKHMRTVGLVAYHIESLLVYSPYKVD